MNDAETLDRARLLFVGDTQGDRLAREVIQIAERAAKKAALWEEIAEQREKELATLRAQRDELWEQSQTEADSASPYSYAVAEKAKPPR